LYRPILSLRLRYNISSLLIEYPLRTYLMKWIGKIYENGDQPKVKPRPINRFCIVLQFAPSFSAG